MSLLSRRGFLLLGAGVAGALEAGAQRLRLPARKPWNAAAGRALRKCRDPIPTVCRSCPAHCGLLAFRDGDRVVQVLPHDGSPTNLAGLCPGAYAGLERAYDPDRILTPLRRVGARGSGRWQEVSWEEALAAIRSALESPRGEKVLHLGQEELFAEELRPALGWTQVLVDEPVPGRPGPGSGEAFYGAPLLPADLSKAQRIFLFGAKPCDGPVDVPELQRLLAARQRGAEVHLFDAFEGATGNFAAWEPVRPGTEALVAFCLARLVLASGRFDESRFASRVADPPGRLLEALASYTVPAAARISGVSESRLAELAETFLAEAPAVAVARPGSAAAPAAALLNHLRGAVEAPGGVRTGRGPFFVKPLRINATPGVLLEALAGRRSEASLYFTCNANPAYDSPASARTLADQDRVGLLVAMETHLHETAALADFFLPLATPLESWGLVEGCLSDGRTYLMLQQPTTRPASEARKLRAPGTPQSRFFEPAPRALGQARSVSEVLLSLAHGRAGKPGAPPDVRSLLEDLLRRSWGPGSLDSLVQRGIWVSDETRPPAQAPRVSFRPFIAPIEEPSPARSFRLVGYRPTTLAAGYANSRRGLEIAHRCEAYVNRKTGQRLGLRDGDRVRVTTSRGSVELPVKLIQGLHPDAVALPDGLGHWAGGAAARGRNGRPEGAPFDGATAPSEPLWWAEAGPGVSYRALVPFRAGADGARCWDAVEVTLTKA